MNEQIHHHILPVKTYFMVFTALMVLTGVTVWVAFYDLGILNTFVAVTIAVVKATVVALYFMHLKYSARITTIAALAGVIWLVVMLSLTVSDYIGRPWIPFPDGW